MPRLLICAAFILFTSLMICDVRAEAIKSEERKYQDQIFKNWWDIPLIRKLDRLPREGRVPEFRVPYSGHDYPDSRGGTDVPVGSHRVSPMRKYDRAFNNGRSLATSHERYDVTRLRKSYYVSTGWFGGGRRLVTDAPGWHGHCNAWTAASMRHAEPQRSVVSNGVTFTPADIKALLADVYMYSETEHLGGIDYVINPGTFHVTLTNWLGRAEHPVGMEARPGEVVYNYPIYAYQASIRLRSQREAEVQLRATYGYNSPYESDRSPRISRAKYFHYMLELDENGEIVGGYYFRDSSQIDMLWAPLNPSQGGEEGNELGNPHVDAKTVMALWRASVPDSLRKKWRNVDPTPEDSEYSADALPVKLWGGWKPRASG